MTQLPLEPEPEPIVGDVADLVHRYGYGAVMSELLLHAPLRVVPSAPARASDPETSEAAGPRSNDVSRFSERSRQGRLLRVFSAEPRTDYEATAAVVGVMSPPSVWDGCRRRCSDLRAAGYLVDSGERRNNAHSPDMAVVWKITRAGEKAIASLDDTGWSR